MATPIPTPVFDWNSPDRAQAFREFKQLSNMWFRVKNIPVKEQYNYIVMWSGREGLRMFNTWDLSEDQCADPNNIWTHFAGQVQPTENFRIHRLEFQRFRQDNSESIEDFVLRCKSKASKCMFPAKKQGSDQPIGMMDERIIEVLISGVKYPEVQKLLLAKDSKLNLEEAIDIARAHEASTAHMHQLQTMDKADIHVFQKAKRCRFCATQHQPKACPAYKSTCNACGKRGHWRKCCPNRSQGGKTGGYNKNFKKQNSGPQSQKYSQRGREEKRDMHPLDFKDDETQEIEDTFDSLSLGTITVNLHVDSIPEVDNRDEVIATLQVSFDDRPGNHTLKVKVDTGAQGNILPVRIFKKVYPKQVDEGGHPLRSSLMQRRTTLVCPNKTQIPHYGCVSFLCRYGEGDWARATFYVVDTDGPAILGLPSSRKLKLVTLHCAMSETGSKPIKDKEDLRSRFPDRFRGIGRFPGTFHLTLREDAEPVVHPPRRLPIHLKDELEQELRRMEDIGVISKVTEPTDWVSSLAVSRKSNGKLRICLDPKDLNRATKRTHHKTPTLEEITHKMSGAKVFTKLDARHGYWSVVLDEESSFMTTFNSPLGRFRYLRLPFGLNVSQDIFQEKMDTILEQCPGTIGIADDVVVFGQDQLEHDKNLINLMEVSQEYGLVFNPDKCEINIPSVKFFGCYYDAAGVHPDPDKVASIKSIPPPENVKDLQRFLGMVQYLSPFVAHMADHTDALRGLLRKDSEWQWTATHQRAFEALKERISESTTLTYFDPRKPTVIQVDASQKGVGAALLQDNKPVAFASKALTPTEQRYANIERELLAVVFGCTRFHTYVFGSSFTIQSDHKPLENIQHKNLADTPPRLQRMMLRLQPYNFKVVYRPGKEMLLADALSRLNPSEEPTLDFEMTIHAVHYSDEKLEEIRKLTEADETLRKLVSVVTDGWPEDPKDLHKDIRTFWSCRDKLSVEDGILMKGDCVFIPGPLRQDVLQMIHTGHLGIVKSQQRAKSSVYWPGISKDVEDMTRSCMTCQAHQRQQMSEPLITHDVPEGPWQVVGTDLFFFNNKEYLIITDYFSKCPFVKQVSGRCTSDAIIQLTKLVFSEHGIPTKVISDNGPQFASEEYHNFSQTWGFKHVTSSPHYPRSNGLVERSIQTVKAVMQKCLERREDILMGLLCLRTTPISGDIPSPTEILYGRKIRSNLPSTSGRTDPTRDDVRRLLIKRQEKQKEQHDKHGVKTLPDLHVGQRAMMREVGTGRPTWIPVTVTGVSSEPRSYIVHTPNGRSLRRNRSHLRNFPATQRNSNLTDEKGTNRNDNQQQSSRSLGNHQDTTQPRTYQTRSGRPVKPPKRYIEEH